MAEVEMRHRRARGWMVVAGVVCWAALCGGGAPADAEEVVAKHKVLGVLRAQKHVEISDATRGWHAAEGKAALVEKSGVRTSADGAGLLDFGPDGLIGLYPDSRVALGQRTDGVVRIALKSGELSFRLPDGSGLWMYTRGGIVRASELVSVGGTGGVVEGFLRVEPSGESVVRVRSGAVLLKGVTSPVFSPMSAGEEARFAVSGDTPRVVRVAQDASGNDASEPPAGDLTGTDGPEVSSVFLDNPALAAVVGGVVLGSAGLALGLRYGVFDGDSDDDHEGSAFVPDSDE